MQVGVPRLQPDLAQAAPTSGRAVVVENLVKAYGRRRAVDGLSFDIQPGEVFALLGPNGAGKTTTIEILEGYRRPDGGRVRVLGLDPIAEGSALKSRIGVMLQEGGLYPAITPREALRLFARFYRSPRDPEELLRLVGLEAAAATRFRRLSGGQKQRLSLALALIPRPELVFLDEPTTGLDPQARRSTWEVIAALKHEGVTVVLTTHYLEEAERLADRVAIVDEGRLVALGTPESLIAAASGAVRLRAARQLDARDLEALPSARSVACSGPGAFVLQTDDVPGLLVEITTLLRDRQISLTELRVGEGSLEDAFIALTGKDLVE
ncbi:MAG TPA: ABC transporter ATP-binding protein [Chloroflexota bacterium]|nr:ABC transporter ATP-binding protein [Chloroflexota bacterium]